MAAVLADFDTAHCGIIHDAQLDNYGRCLATASADGHIRLWDTRDAEEPAFLSDLGGHAGAVYQVAWAPADLGVLLASAGSDGSVMVWGQRSAPGDWRVLHCEKLKAHGSIRAVEWASAEHGALLACAASDGTVTVIGHQGSLADATGEVTHHWQSRTFSAHPKSSADAVSWASAPSIGEGPLGLNGARLATAGADGLHVWCWNEVRGEWDAEAMDTTSTEAPACDVDWKPWDGCCEMIAVASGDVVALWYFEKAEGSSEARRWHAKQTVDVKQRVWKVSWMEMGSTLMLSCGEDKQSVVLMKQRLSGMWDIMDVEVQE